MRISLFAIVLSFSAAYTHNFYDMCDKIGTCTDYVLSKGDLSTHDTMLFKEVAASLGIAERDIKPKNSGLLLRLFGGYNNALSIAHHNRVYFNAACLATMSEGQKRFLMAHELVHHKMQHCWKRMALLCSLSIFVKLGKFVFLRSMQNSDAKGFQSLEEIFWYHYLFNCIIWKRISFPSLLAAQYIKSQEEEADSMALQLSGVTIEDAAQVMDNLYNPNTRDWPLYAQFMQKIQNIYIAIAQLPVIEWHMPHLVSKDARVDRLRGESYYKRV